MPPLIRSLSGLLALLVLLAGCEPLGLFQRLGPPGPQQPLVVGIPADAAFQQAEPSSEGMEGFTRDLVKSYAAQLGVGVNFIVAPDYPSLLAMIRAGKLHMVAGLPAPNDEPKLMRSEPLFASQQIIVQQGSALPVDSLEKLAGREITLLPGAPQAASLRELKIDPAPQLIERPGQDELELLATAARRSHTLVATDQLHFDIATNFYPELDIAFELPQTVNYVWVFPEDGKPLQEAANRFIDTIRQDGTLSHLYDRYFGHLYRMGTRDIEVFLEHARSRLPDYRPAFQAAQEISGIDWRLLAALGYQESKWDPLATSPTGVRGLMMLTEDTADRLNVKNRLNARESILAGAKYLAFLVDNLPDEIGHPDRLWFGLAAYNLGLGHLKGARAFAPERKLDANSWADMKEILPLLSQPQYYARLKSGRARGGEALIMVENVRNYFDILSRFEPAHLPPSLKPKAGKAGAMAAGPDGTKNGSRVGLKAPPPAGLKAPPPGLKAPPPAGPAA